MRDLTGPGPNDRILQRTPYTFDASVWELFLAFVSGSALVIARPDEHANPAYLIELINSENISIAQFVPSILTILLESPGVETCSSLRILFSGGEALSLDLQRLDFSRFLQSLRTHGMHHRCHVL